ncbi:hypothetical protein M426DRAFT_324448 [Hypoxylon sp. CI-4A]|nr:hypothetical protein M426DRAFT_324448 [Hypoxylon sp. CI-4A]
MVSFSNPEAISTIYPIRPGFPKSDFYVTLRPYTPERGSMPAVFNTLDEQIHKLMKNPIAPLFSLSNVVMFEDSVDEVLRCLSEQLDGRFAGKDEAFDLGQWLQYFAFDYMGTMSFSRRYGFLEQGKDVGGMLKAISEYFRLAAPMTQMTWLDPLIYKNKIVHRFRQTAGVTILGFVSKVVGERLNYRNDGNGRVSEEASDKDFLARYIKIQKCSSVLPSWMPIAWTFSNVFAGSDSVGNVMQTVMYSLLSCPGSLLRLQEELEAADLSRPCPKWNEIRDLPYLDACIQEALRIHPPFALPLERVVPSGGVSVLGTYLPEGTSVGGNPYVVNRHAPTFGVDVESWNPDRWLQGDEGHKKKLEQSLLTFGAGRRICLGKNIGIFEMKKIIPFLILNYDTQILDPNTLTIENRFFLKRRGFHCRMKRRQ